MSGSLAQSIIAAASFSRTHARCGHLGRGTRTRTRSIILPGGEGYDLAGLDLKGFGAVDQSSPSPTFRSTAPGIASSSAATATASTAASVNLSVRWILDARFGHKADAVSLMAEWVKTVGVSAGIIPARAAIFTGSVGAPESRCELQLSQFASLSELDVFFADIPSEAHVAWGRRLAPHVIDGSPHWVVMRRVALHASADDVEIVEEEKVWPAGGMTMNTREAERARTQRVWGGGGGEAQTTGGRDSGKNDGGGVSDVASTTRTNASSSDDDDTVDGVKVRVRIN